MVENDMSQCWRYYLQVIIRLAGSTDSKSIEDAKLRGGLGKPTPKVIEEPT